MIMRFKDQIEDPGTPAGAWIISTNAENAMVITILQNAQYSMGATCDNENGVEAGVMGFSKNSTELTTPIYAVNVTNRLNWDYMGVVATIAQHKSATWQGYLYSNDTVRVHTLGKVPTTASSAHFWINQICK